MDEAEFIKKYWYKNTQVVTVTNPRNEDYVFQMVVETGLDPLTGKLGQEPRTYSVPHGGSERFPGPIANLYLDQMSKLIAQDEDKIQQYIDFALKAQYYDDLVVSVEDLIASHVQQTTPDYLRPAAQATAAPEQPFAGAVAAQDTPPAPKKLGRPPKAATTE